MPSISIPEEIAVRAERFAGREWVLDEVVDWLTDSTAERFLLITGEPGAGKTALAAWLAGAGPEPVDEDARSKLQRVRGSWGAAHFCVAENQRGTLHPERFAKALSRQLTERYDDYGQAVLQRLAPHINIHLQAHENWGQMIGAQIENLIINNADVDAVYNSTVREPLEELSRHQPGEHVLILVDALDEALAFGSPNIVTLLAGSGDLPNSVRFLLTSRKEPKVIEQFNQVRLLDLSSPEGADQPSDDIRAYVEQRMRGDELRRHIPQAESAGITDALVIQAAGNFLYIKFLLDEVESGKRSLFSVDLSGLPKGLYGLYRAYLDRMFPEMLQVGSSQRWQEQFQPLLGCLSVATPAAPRDTLPDWLEQDESQVTLRLAEARQIVEDVTGIEATRLYHRLYHRSMAEFLATDTYQENGAGASTLNRYYTPPREQHARIVRYYLDNFHGAWRECDSYGLRQLVSHVQASLALENKPKVRREKAAQLYTVVRDKTFRDAQLLALGDEYVTLADLQTTLEIALAGDDMVNVLACAGAYRSTIRSTSMALPIFEAIQDRDFKRATQRAQLCHVTTDWKRVLHLYLAWEAAEAGRVDVVQKALDAVRSAPLLWAQNLCNAFLARIVRTLADKMPKAEAISYIADVAPEHDADRLLETYNLARPLDPGTGAHLASELEQQVARLEALIADRKAEAASMEPFLNEEIISSETIGLRRLLVQTAADASGQQAIDRLLKPIVTNPYPQYRDIALEALGIATLAVPGPIWLRSRLQRILRAGLDQEGVTFTFDLPAILLAESTWRNKPALNLAAYIEQAHGTTDRWGTAMRAHSAQAAALLWQGHRDDAFRKLQEAARLPSGFAGYATITVLSLANRCHELGRPNDASTPIWGSDRNIALLDGAMGLAQRVRDWNFREQRIQLVQAYRRWWDQNTLGLEGARDALKTISDDAMRMASIDHLSARWSGPVDGPNREGLKALVPLALPDATTLDAVLGRLVGPRVRQLSDGDLAEAIRICDEHLTTGRPWELGQWR